MSALPSQNEFWGFLGTIHNFKEVIDKQAAWKYANAAIKKATKGSPKGIQRFLDSRHGRHFADEVGNQMARKLDWKKAIDGAVAVHMKWKVKAPRRGERQGFGPAKKMTPGPYLTSHVEFYTDDANWDM